MCTVFRFFFLLEPTNAYKVPGDASKGKRSVNGRQVGSQFRWCARRSVPFCVCTFALTSVGCCLFVVFFFFFCLVALVFICMISVMLLLLFFFLLLLPALLWQIIIITNIEPQHTGRIRCSVEAHQTHTHTPNTIA